ncbi:YpjP family protein [Ureibacillus terrenus]|uniref:Cell division protein FtsK n=1 Tax=Ureibacillus terrenus TaxID=118246 RepID=A0A540V192_9BACL|nr:YpjP family protein [Ureibacillus terrenus]MED3662344.1 YpjP family protein [Ureibacillus terrenus]MED3764518.1 YpjP family protein [Ureibacillus terrenus]TQE90524.1 hypothetical protein FKZ59_09635 [Ureibacillus terrenus]
MKKWLKQSLVFLVALITLGFIPPSHSIWEQLENGQDSNRTTSSDYNNIDVQEETVGEAPSEEGLAADDPIGSIIRLAHEQSYIKFGSKIGPVIEDEFEERIFPAMAQIIASKLDRLDDQAKQYLTITEKPGGNYSEKIFHIADGRTGKDLLRFHVRTEKRPQEGYYYNFHYHTYEDDYESHYTIGDIYYSKNTPPKWLS